MHEFDDFGIKFTISKSNSVDQKLKDEFYSGLSVIDKEIILYYLKQNFEIDNFYLIESSKIIFGYAGMFIDKSYANLVEIYIRNEFRELGLGTKLLNYIREDIKKMNLLFRAIVLPSDRTAKNFYESNAVTARIILMEEKRENSRRRP